MNETTVGSQLKLDRGKARWWTVQAASERFSIVVQQVAFKPRGTLQYSILDWASGVRGAVNLIGGGYGDGSYSCEECERLLAECETGEVEVSSRNQVPLVVLARRPGVP